MRHDKIMCLGRWQPPCCDCCGREACACLCMWMMAASSNSSQQCMPHAYTHITCCRHTRPQTCARMTSERFTPICMLAGTEAVRPAALCSRSHLLAGPQHPDSPHQPCAAIWAPQRIPQEHRSPRGLQGPQVSSRLPGSSNACAEAGVPASWRAVTAADQLLHWSAGSGHAACRVSALAVLQAHRGLSGCMQDSSEAHVCC
jgi:hypothetical protein